MGQHNAIEARGLTRTFRRPLRAGWSRFTAVDGLDLTVPAGSVFGLLGPNGAGKTTTIHMLLGLDRPTTGSVSVFGSSASHASARARIGFVPEKFELPGFLTARRFLRLHADLASVDAHARTREIDRCLDRMSLLDRADDTVSTFSKGMQQRLAIAQALLGSPDLIVLDEPTSALDPIGRRDVRELISELRGRGTTVLLNSHLLAEVEQVCDEVAILDRGRRVSSHRVGGIEGANRERTDLGVQVQLLKPSVAVIDLAKSLLGAGATSTTDDALTIVRGAVQSREALGSVVRSIVEDGGVIVGVDATGESLESLFMRVVGADTDSEVTA